MVRRRPRLPTAGLCELCDPAPRSDESDTGLLLVNVAIATRISSSRAAAALSPRPTARSKFLLLGREGWGLRGLAGSARRPPLLPASDLPTPNCPTLHKKSATTLELGVAHVNRLSAAGLAKRSHQALKLPGVGTPIQALRKLSNDPSALGYGASHLQLLEDLAGREDARGVKEILGVGSTFRTAHQSSPQPLDSRGLADAQLRCGLRCRERPGKKFEQPITCPAPLIACSTGIGDDAGDGFRDHPPTISPISTFVNRRLSSSAIRRIVGLPYNDGATALSSSRGARWCDRPLRRRRCHRVDRRRRRPSRCSATRAVWDWAAARTSAR